MVQKVWKGYARKAYEKGEPVLVIPNRVKLNSKLAVWTTIGEAGDFDKLCEVVFYYNCSPKNGTELAYYVKEA